MQDNQERNVPSREEQEGYAKKLAQLAVSFYHMPQDQRQYYAPKMQELKERLGRLPPWLSEVYEAEVKRLMAQKAQAAAKRSEPSVHSISREESTEDGLLHAPKQEDATHAAEQAHANSNQQQPSVSAAQNTGQVEPRIAEQAEEKKPENVSISESEQWEDVFEQDGQQEHEHEETHESLSPLQPEPEEKPKKKKRIGCLIVILIFVALIAAGIAAMVWAMNDIIGNRSRTIEAKTIEIEKGSYLKSISETLEENGIIRSALLFQLYVKVQQEAGALQYGTFELSSDMTYDELIELLKTEQKRDTVRVTFPEGIPAVQFAQRMEEAGLCTAEEFLQVANEGDFSQFKFWNLRDENPNQFMKCEGYLFPETYEFYRDDDVYNMVAKIYGEFDKRFTDEMYAKVQEMGFTLTQFVTLASIVQEEAGLPEHQADVAAVFMNRLGPNSIVSLLQSNCSSYIQNDDDNNYINNTIAPACGGWENIPQEIIDAYDTYKTPGLPAGPISNPGMDALTNTLNYASSPYYGDYYFFVTDLAGTYYYAKTDAEHEVNKAAAAQVNASL